MKILVTLFKSVTIIILILFSASYSMAQKKVDVITLKNGNILKGKIVRQVPGEFVEIETNANNFWQFDMEDISDIRFELKRSRRKIKDTLSAKNEGMFYEIRMGVLVGDNDNINKAPFSLLMSGTYVLKNGIALGAGFGYDTFDETQMPLFGELKYYTKIKGIKSFLFCQSGYSFSLEDSDDQNHYLNGDSDIDSKGGWLINPGVGFVFGNSARTNFTLNIGYRFQKMEQKWHNKYTDESEYLKQEINRLSIHLGIIF